MYDVAIIGAGVCGTLIARELSKYQLKVIVLEKENDVANGTTKANSGIIHAGYDAQYSTLRGMLNVSGNKMFDKICGDLDVKFSRIGSIVVAFNQEEMIKIHTLYENGRRMGVPNLNLLNGSEIRRKEPLLSNEIVGGLFAPSAGIVNPWELAIAAMENAIDNGVELRLNYRVDRIERKDGIVNNGFVIRAEKDTVESRYVINSSGLYGDEINNMINNAFCKITPVKGQYYLLDKSVGNAVNTVIFQCPTTKGKGVLITPTIHGNLLVGPDAEGIEGKDDTTTSLKGLDYIKTSANRVCNSIAYNKVITTFSGLRSEPDSGDFIISSSKDNRCFVNVIGIKSPGLSASPAIALRVRNILNDNGLELKYRKDFKRKRIPVIRFDKLTDREKTDVIRKDDRYGRVVCRCENITEGEIVDAIHRNCGGVTIDGLKKRVRPGMGRCQGGFCTPLIIEILARELGLNKSQILKCNTNSPLLIGETKDASLFI